MILPTHLVLHQQLEHMPVGQQRQVLNFARALAATRTHGVAGQELLQFTGTISQDDLGMMSQAIEEECEKVDTNEW